MIKQTWIQMGMPVTVAICDTGAGSSEIAAIASLFEEVNQRFSTYLETSEVSRLNAGEIKRASVSSELGHILNLCEQTRRETDGYFEIERDGRIDPSGLVKGWAIQRAADLLRELGFSNFYVDAGGDIQTSGRNADDEPWRVGIRNLFKRDEQVKTLWLSGEAIATSGTAIRGPHIYDPFDHQPVESELVSLTVVGESIYEADRMATAAFAMGRDGLAFIAEWPGLEAYAIDTLGIAEYTLGFASYVR